jgi:predicted DNA-binding WGR domain protein
MRIYLQTLPGLGESPKFLHLMLERDLFGGVELIRESGQQGQRGTLKKEQFLSLDEAQAALEKVRDQHLKRGYRIMFSQGAEAPPHTSTAYD